MLRLLLFRHAKSDWPDGVDDHERPLAERGRRATPLMASYMAGEDLIPDFVLVSPARRTLETWKLLRPAMGDDVRWREEPRIYEAPAQMILNVVRAAEPGIGTLLVIGHNPGLQDTALRLAGRGREADLIRLRRKYPTAGLAVIVFTATFWSDIADQSGELERFVTPGTIGDG